MTPDPLWTRLAERIPSATLQWTIEQIRDWLDEEAVATGADQISWLSDSLKEELVTMAMPLRDYLQSRSPE